MMARTDNTQPDKIREAEAPELPWFRILNQQGRRPKGGGMSYKKRLHRARTHSERRYVKNLMANGGQPGSAYDRHSVRRDMW
jgi:hypothetical protein